MARGEKIASYIAGSSRPAAAFNCHYVRADETCSGSRKECYLFRHKQEYCSFSVTELFRGQSLWPLTRYVHFPENKPVSSTPLLRLGLSSSVWCFTVDGLCAVEWDALKSLKPTVPGKPVCHCQRSIVQKRRGILFSGGPFSFPHASIVFQIQWFARFPVWVHTYKIFKTKKIGVLLIKTSWCIRPVFV